MAKVNYQFEKRQRDLAKKNKQQEKRNQKLARHVADDGQQEVSANPPVVIPDSETKPEA